MIKRVAHVKYLGVYLYEYRGWDTQKTYLCNNLAKYLSVFCNVRMMVPEKLKKQLYYSFVYSRIAYGIEVYGSCNTTLLTKVQVMQNKLLKILYNKDCGYSTNTLYHELKLLQVKHIHELLLLKFIHIVLNGNPVKRFEVCFIKRRQIHDYETRPADFIQTAKCKTTYGKRHVHYICATKWNNLEETVKTMKLSTFEIARNPL